MLRKLCCSCKKYNNNNNNNNENKTNDELNRILLRSSSVQKPM